MNDPDELRLRRVLRAQASAIGGAAFARGALRVSGTIPSRGALWQTSTDRLGWSTVALLGVPEGDEALQTAAAALRRVAIRWSDPLAATRALRDTLLADERTARTGFAMARVDPTGRLVEFLNVSLPTVVHWDPVEGCIPYEPIAESLESMMSTPRTEILRLEPGAALLLATDGVLAPDAGWNELRGFTRAFGLDPLGATLADAPPAELERILHAHWRTHQDSPTGLVVLGRLAAMQHVA